MHNHARSALAAVVFLLLLVGLPLVALLVILVWVGVELHHLSKSLGRRGSLAFSCLVAAVAIVVLYGGIMFRSNLQLIEALEKQGATASMSGAVFPGPVNYVSLGRNVGDGELEEIVTLNGLDKLEFVVAKGSPITDKGLSLLHRFEHLTNVYIGDTDVTPDGIEQLRDALPNCVVAFVPRERD